KVRGNFTDFTGVITIGDSAENSTLQATVQAASITTNNEMRDGHLKTADFLDIENNPTLTLKSTQITPKGGDNYQMVADLTVKGITKAVNFEGSLENGSLVVGNKIVLEFAVEAHSEALVSAN